MFSKKYEVRAEGGVDWKGVTGWQLFVGQSLGDRAVLLRTQIQLYRTMAQNQDKTSPLQSKLCTKCSSMYGNPTFEDMCSMCFKKEKSQQKLNELKKIDPPSTDPHPTCLADELLIEPVVDTKKRPAPVEVVEERTGGRCSKCERKTKMLGYSCKHCSREFCRLHRLPEEHQCEVDFVSLGRKQIKTDNPTITHSKIEQI